VLWQTQKGAKKMCHYQEQMEAITETSQENGVRFWVMMIYTITLIIWILINGGGIGTNDTVLKVDIL